MLFKYKVNYWDGYDDGSKSKEELGLVAGKTYGVNEIIGGLKL